MGEKILANDISDRWLSSVPQLCQTLCNPMDCSTPDFPVHRQFPELTQTHLHWVGDAIQPSHPVVPFSCLQSFPASGSFPLSQLFATGGQSIGVSALPSFLPTNIQGLFISFRIDWFGLLDVQGTLIWILQHHSLKASIFHRSVFLMVQPLKSIHDYWKNHSFDYMDLCWQSDVSAF